MGENVYQMTAKLPSRHIIVPNGRNIYSKGLKIPTFSTSMSSKTYPNFDFWYENISSGKHCGRAVLITKSPSTTKKFMIADWRKITGRKFG
jgi:hypothetical protein